MNHSTRVRNPKSKVSSQINSDQKTIWYENCTSHFAGRRCRGGGRPKIRDVLRSVRWTFSSTLKNIASWELTRLKDITIYPFRTRPLYQMLPTPL